MGLLYYLNCLFSKGATHIIPGKNEPATKTAHQTHPAELQQLIHREDTNQKTAELVWAHRPHGHRPHIKETVASKTSKQLDMPQQRPEENLGLASAI